MTVPRQPEEVPRNGLEAEADYRRVKAAKVRDRMLVGRRRPVKIAVCPRHGVHGERESCFECGGPVERWEVVAVDVVRREQELRHAAERERDQALSALREFPLGAPKPNPADVVQVLMTEEMARRFEERCLGSHTPGETRLAGPLLFSEDDVPTYVIGVAGGSDDRQPEGVETWTIWVCDCGTRATQPGKCRSHPRGSRAMGPEMHRVEVAPLAALRAEWEKRERVERELAQLRDDEDSAGAECSRLESDQLDIHDVLESAGLSGAINAQSIIERIERGVADRDAAFARADQAVKERDRWIRLYNRLETAVRRHVEAKEASGFSDEADDALASAHRAVMRDSHEARPPATEPDAEPEGRSA